MTLEEKAYELEEKKFQLEKKRDKVAWFKFLFGTVLLSCAAFIVSEIQDSRQNTRAKISSEKQIVTSIVYRSPSETLENKVEVIDDLLKTGFTEPTNELLRLIRLNINIKIEDLKKLTIAAEIAKKDAVRKQEIARTNAEKAEAATAIELSQQASRELSEKIKSYNRALLIHNGSYGKENSIYFAP